MPATFFDVVEYKKKKKKINYFKATVLGRMQKHLFMQSFHANVF